MFDRNWNYNWCNVSVYELRQVSPWCWTLQFVRVSVDCNVCLLSKVYQFLTSDSGFCCYNLLFLVTARVPTGPEKSWNWTWVLKKSWKVVIFASVILKNQDTESINLAKCLDGFSFFYSAEKVLKNTWILILSFEQEPCTAFLIRTSALKLSCITSFWRFLVAKFELV